MDECPHCGEPIEDEAASCPHCGSDVETGWNPDKEYYSLELPDSDAEPGQEYAARSVEIHWESLLSLLTLFACASLFLWTGATLYGTASIPFAVILAVCLIFFHRWVRPPRA